MGVHGERGAGPFRVEMHAKTRRWRSSEGFAGLDVGGVSRDCFVVPQYEDYHRTIIGYHGTTRETAEAIVRHEAEFRPSENPGDWLGHGVYFWEYAPQQAWKWARTRYGEEKDVAVLGAMIRLGSCLDLLEPANTEEIRGYYNRLVLEVEAAGRALPQNRNADKRLDCAVFQYAASLLEVDGCPVETIRGVYVPTGSAQRLWKRSWLYEEAHIQLCVRDTKAILGTWLLKPESP